MPHVFNTLVQAYKRKYLRQCFKERKRMGITPDGFYQDVSLLVTDTTVNHELPRRGAKQQEAQWVISKEIKVLSLK